MQYKLGVAVSGMKRAYARERAGSSSVVMNLKFSCSYFSLTLSLQDYLTNKNDRLFCMCIVGMYS